MNRESLLSDSELDYVNELIRRNLIEDLTRKSEFLKTEKRSRKYENTLRNRIRKKSIMAMQQLTMISYAGIIPTDEHIRSGLKTAPAMFESIVISFMYNVYQHPELYGLSRDELPVERNN